MASGKQGFPKTFCDETTTNGDGYPLYKRPMNDPVIVYRATGPVSIDNRLVAS